MLKLENDYKSSVENGIIESLLKYSHKRRGTQMIDIHCHILPGVDDGAKHMEESLSMARAAVKNGIHTIIATPHHKNGIYNNPRKSVLADLKLLNKRIEEENIPLSIVPGQEVRIYGEVIEGIEQEEILTVNETSRYVLIELPANDVPLYTRQLLFDIQMNDYVPIIVHPERNTVLREQPSKLYEFVKNGALTQITAGSLIGKFGTKIESFTKELIEHNLTHFVASDAHNLRSRPFNMKEATQEIKKRYGDHTLDTFMDNAQSLIDDKPIFIDEPHRIKRKRFLGLF